MRGADRQTIFCICSVALCIMATLGLSMLLSGGGILKAASLTGVKGENFYAICTGGYDDIALARNTAELINSRGGAGYVLKEDGAYEIFYAVYPSESEAKSVLEGLGESGAYIKPLPIVKSKLKWASGDIKKATVSALKYFDMAFDALYDCSNSLNAEDISLEDAKVKTGVLHAQIEDLKSAFYQIATDDGDKNIISVKVALITALALIDNIDFSNERKCAASIRYQIVQLVLSRQALMSAL